ncbi:MAG: prepilin peptidase [Candidatus Acididesulfobacter guangdongensis]|uniref:Prepilin leader peptidase/N-methyltransferase n=1 Tax=Acididesulfobacter guangdongensis TaxID=2597225 RepID=A0A519BGB2_ACIG2|nr:MAG: prepilin peptidase [Candidatus Acididesulfobacter guangdongensis]
MLLTDNLFYFASFFVFIFGLIIGSFLNVVIYRLPEGKSLLFPASSCPECGTKIKFYDNIPIVSYIILGGKCRACGNRIPVIYPAIELLSAVLFYLLFIKLFYNAFFHFNITSYDLSLFKDYLTGRLLLFMAYGFFIFILIPISFIDFFHRIIPDSLNMTLIIAGFLFNIFLLHKGFLFPFAGFIAGGLSFYLIAVFYELVRKKEGLGGGDIKLIAGIGAFLGVKGVIFTIFAGSVFGLLGFILSLLYLNIQDRTKTTSSRSNKGNLIQNDDNYDSGNYHSETIGSANSLAHNINTVSANDNAAHIGSNNTNPEIHLEKSELNLNNKADDNFISSKIPFGPFLSMAAVLYTFYGSYLMNIYIDFIRR